MTPLLGALRLKKDVIYIFFLNAPYWAKQSLSDESFEAYQELLETAFHSAPWWALRYIEDYYYGPELLEFTCALPPYAKWDDEWRTKLLGCILAFQRKGKLVYALPDTFKPGSALAQRLGTVWFSQNGR